MDILTIARSGDLFDPNHLMAMKEGSHVDSPSTSRKILFAGSYAVAGKSKKKIQRRIDFFRFFIPPPMTIRKKQVMDSQKQLSRHRQRDSRNKHSLSPKLATASPPTGLEERNSQPILADFGRGVSAHQPTSFRFPRR